MTGTGANPGEQWVDGDYEAGADPTDVTPASAEDEVPDEGNDGASVGAGEPSTFEPEEDTASLPKEAVTETPMANRQQA